MEMIEFCKGVKKELEVSLGEAAAISINQITKNNGVVLNSVVIAREDRNISPNIYLDEFYKDYKEGREFKDIIEEIHLIYKESRFQGNLDMSFFLDYGKMKSMVAYKVIGYERNRKILEEVPHIRFLDMAIVFYCNISEKELNNATILIYNNHLGIWGITQEVLYKDAKRNTKKLLPPRIIPIERMMREIFSEDLKKEFSTGKIVEENLMPDEEWFENAAEQLFSSVTEYDSSGKMFVMGNESKLFGAIAMIYDSTLKDFSAQISSDLFILPSSIHEVILIPDDGKQIAYELWRMVCEINDTQVEPEDVLTDALYYYSRKNNNIKKLY
ncbi:DUF5688 family protein [Kineothrix sp. MB12-C1]|uniref:DUF5688 family protein n=1 Tax=Kineothrix sp. MB12-C1 TaxID=3070215 RepID=UPI0027D32420|nr:DUF5688 family protein [Kineothrix sp. MB12-C1]WMC92289.1 DUF5688 family protein [Kineothrix sp. MB12-C1]